MNDIINVIKENNVFNIYMHVSPDGDTLGSALALHAALLLLGKKAYLICDDVPAKHYEFLFQNLSILNAEKAKPAPVSIAIDCADLRRIGRAKALFEKSNVTVNIDHHLTNPSFAQYNFVNGHSSSTGEIIAQLLEKLGITINKEIATYLYTAISTDTGSFSYSNTTPACHILASKYVELGIDVAKLSSQLMNSRSLGKTRLLGLAISKLELFFEDRIGLIYIEQKDLASIGVSPEDCESIVDYIRDIDTVEIAIFIREMNNNKFKVSLRSKLYADVGSIAQGKGGGGHVRAAGFPITGDYDEIKAELINSAAELLHE